jgi:hypothetical protein
LPLPVGPTTETFGGGTFVDPNDIWTTSADSVLFPLGGPGLFAPAAGQVTTVTVRGNYVPGSCPVMPDSTCQDNVLFQDLRPQAGGGFLVVSTTQPFTLPSTLGTYPFNPTNFFVQQGDLIGLATIGGSFNVVATTPGASANGFVGHNLDMNGDTITNNTPISNGLLQVQSTLTIPPP